MPRDEYLIIHCSTGDDHPGDDSSAMVAQAVASGSFSDNPYDGTIEMENGQAIFEPGRSLEKTGAHCRGWNTNSTGWAWIGGDLNLGFERITDGYTQNREDLPRDKWDLMVLKAAEWCIENGRTVDRIKFHREIPGSGKTCPGVGLDPNQFRAEVNSKIQEIRGVKSESKLPGVLMNELIYLRNLLTKMIGDVK